MKNLMDRIAEKINDSLGNDYRVEGAVSGIVLEVESSQEFEYRISDGDIEVIGSAWVIPWSAQNSIMVDRFGGLRETLVALSEKAIETGKDFRPYSGTILRVEYDGDNDELTALSTAIPKINRVLRD